MISQVTLSNSLGTTIGPEKKPPQPPSDFTSMLSGFLEQTVSAVREGEQAAHEGLQGKVPLQTIVDKVTSAEQALQAGIALRDKIVAAYLEISRMPI